ncbi:TonB-dependent receptor, partial [Pseudomonas tolaasii]
MAAQGGFSYAAETAADDNTGVIQLGATSIEGQAQSTSTYNPVAPSSPKYTEALRDTPQTITVVPKEVIHDQNLLSLRDVLSTVPGITFGAGEGGSGYGDSINLRGFSASGDIYVDGVRDSAQYSRTDPFNLEQVEVVSGASSVYSGSGAVGGTINLVTKQPELRDKTTVSAGIGTDNYKRLTLDSNSQLNDTTAFRLNLMAHGNDVPGRDYEDYSRWGIAPSIAFGLGTPTRVTLSYEHQKDDNTPQYGI